MFQISIQEMHCCHQDIEEQIVRHRQIIIDTENIMKSIKNVEGINELKEKLRYNIKKLEEQQVKYRNVLKTLEVVTMYYNECEKRSIENIELGKTWNLDIILKQNDFSNIATQLKGIKLGGV